MGICSFGAIAARDFAEPGLQLIAGNADTQFSHTFDVYYVKVADVNQRAMLNLHGRRE